MGILRAKSQFRGVILDEMWTNTDVTCSLCVLMQFITSGGCQMMVNAFLSFLTSLLTLLLPVVRAIHY